MLKPRDDGRVAAARAVVAQCGCSHSSRSAAAAAIARSSHRRCWSSWRADAARAARFPRRWPRHSTSQLSWYALNLSLYLHYLITSLSHWWCECGGSILGHVTREADVNCVSNWLFYYCACVLVLAFNDIIFTTVQKYLITIWRKLRCY